MQQMPPKATNATNGLTSVDVIEVPSTFSAVELLFGNVTEMSLMSNTSARSPGVPPTAAPCVRIYIQCMQNSCM